MRSTLILILLVLAAGADARPHVRYAGVHPVPDGGICYIEGLHVHLYAADKVRYREHHGAYVFVGDLPRAYDGPRYVYQGRHPVHVHVLVDSDEPDIEYCHLDGVHYHAFAPPPVKAKVVVRPVPVVVRPVVIHHHHKKHKKHKRWKHRHRHHDHDDDD